MARLRQSVESDCELPELSALLGAAQIQITKGKHEDFTSGKEQGTTYSKIRKPPAKNPSRKAASISVSSENATEVSFAERRNVHKRPLGPTSSNPLLLPITYPTLKFPTNDSPPKAAIEARRNIRETPKRTVARKVDFSAFVHDLADAIEDEEADEDYSDEGDSLSDFIVDDDASEEELRRPRNIRKDINKSPKRRLVRGYEGGRDHRQESSEPEVIDLISPAKAPGTYKKTFPREIPDSEPSEGELAKDFDASPSKAPGTIKKPRSREVFNGQTSEGELAQDLDAILKFSPPRHISPTKRSNPPPKEPLRFTTPPTSPTKPRLQSPSKPAPRIPPSPHRPSLDSFWSQEVINDWNDTYSPSKPSPARRLFPQPSFSSDSDTTPSSPRKSPTKSPQKKDKLAAELKKTFESQKEHLATSFLALLDERVSGSQVSALAASTGGIKIIWSKKLNSTAGRATWKKESLRPRTTTPSTSSSSSSTNPNSTSVPSTTSKEIRYRHHATIELASKVIDSIDRLYNVLAHEYCHLANFMISSIKDQPHGTSFKNWARIVSEKFRDHEVGIEVTTRHSYTIDYKYVWQCSDCGVEYKRHSKSIDTGRHRCGGCKGVLVQVRPVPRGATGSVKKGEGKEGVNGFQKYVKKNYARVKADDAAAGMGEVMVILGREYRERKEAGLEKRGEDGSGEVDDVVRKLDFLSMVDKGREEKRVVEGAREKPILLDSDDE